MGLSLWGLFQVMVRCRLPKLQAMVMLVLVVVVVVTVTAAAVGGVLVML